jgi:hypothetical protein
MSGSSAAARAACADEVLRSRARDQRQPEDLDRFLFEPDDLIVVLGQDGLVTNVAKCLNEQPVSG